MAYQSTKYVGTELEAGLHGAFRIYLELTGQDARPFIRSAIIEKLERESGRTEQQMVEEFMATRERLTQGCGREQAKNNG